MNEVRHVLPFTDFYNEMVNEHYDEREDFINWKRGGGYAHAHAHTSAQRHKYAFIEFAAHVCG